MLIDLLESSKAIGLCPMGIYVNLLAKFRLEILSAHFLRISKSCLNFYNLNIISFQIGHLKLYR